MYNLQNVRTESTGMAVKWIVDVVGILNTAIMKMEHV